MLSSYIKKYFRLFATILILFLIHIILAILQYVSYKRSNVYVIVARVCGVLIDFDSCLALFLVLRRLNTFFRKLKYIQHFIDFDEFINIHKFVGVFILLFGFVHGLMHCINICNTFYS